MLQLTELIITQFKNYDQAKFRFTERIAGITGANGIGKTSLLDAIYYCCFTKSYFTNTAQLNIKIGYDGFRIKGNFTNSNKVLNVIYIQRGTKKEMSLNDVGYTRVAKHIGKIPAVIVAPDDIEMITGSSELRRKFMDAVISQMDEQYLQNLIEYNKILQQRNSYLKQIAEGGNADFELWDILDSQLEKPGTAIFERRKIFTESLLPKTRHFYNRFGGADEIIEMAYESHLNEKPLREHLTENREKDRLLQRTTKGPHRDDLSFGMMQQPFKQLASQGQRKTLLFALRLAEFALLKEHFGFEPLLLLDDIFEKLDEQRMKVLLQIVCEENAGQIFITDTHEHRLREALGTMQIKFQMIGL